MGCVLALCQLVACRGWPWRPTLEATATQGGDGNEQASTQRALPGLAPDPSALQAAGMVSQHLGLWASSCLPPKPGVDPPLLAFHTLFVDF